MPKPFRLTRPEPPEAAVQDAVLRFLALDKRVAWAHRFNTGAMRIPNPPGPDGRSRGHRFVQFAFPGCSDVLGQLVSGHFLAVEVKRPSTKPTPDQAAFLALVAQHGGLAVVARSIDDVARALDGFFRGESAAASLKSVVARSVDDIARNFRGEPAAASLTPNTPADQPVERATAAGSQVGGAAGQEARPAPGQVAGASR
jgi:hypothetical protein